MKPVNLETVRIVVEGKTAVSAVLARPDTFVPGKTDCVVWAHGAGTDMHHPFISYFHDAVAQAGWVSVKFNFIYKEQGRKAPDTSGKLETTFARVLSYVRENEGLRPPRVFAGGKSMGGRIASQVVAKGQDVGGLVFLGYPLHPPGRHDKLRAEHLERIRCPLLFIEGTNDPFCRIDLLARTREQISSPTELYLVEGGNHDFKTPRRLARSPQEIRQSIAAVICDALRRWSAWP